jgi:uncharacterized SAM-binding protein YcdF (DUF218 family)
MRPPGQPFALVVLGSSVRDPGGGYSISRGCRRVVGHAERCAWTRLPEVVVFSGWAPNGGTPEAEQMRALWRGPRIELAVEPTASTTAENAARTLPFLRERGLLEAVVVCTPLHLYRARWFFRRLYAARGIRTSFTTSPTLPSLSAFVWELGALTVRSRQLRAVEKELERRERKT